jgi:phthiocerol/phenolphthiocerol synthesis type-I polyketide synthase E
MGAYAAAVSAGVLSLADGLSLVLAHGRLLDRSPGVAVPLPEADLLAMLADDVIDEYAAAVASVRLHPPRLPWISDRTGAPVTAREACDPAYWAGHLRHPIRFSDALQTLLAGSAGILLEVGPGGTLGSLARQHPGCGPRHTIVQSLPDAAEGAGGAVESLRATGVLWQAGLPVRWSALRGGRPPRRVPLSTYPFQRERFTVEAPTPVVAPPGPAESGPVESDPVEPVPGPDADRSATDPRTPVERTIAEVWREVLRVQHVGIDDDFFELGGQSLHATRVLARLRPALGPDASRLTIMDVFDHSTVRELAALVSGSDPREQPR